MVKVIVSSWVPSDSLASVQGEITRLSTQPDFNDVGLLWRSWRGRAESSSSREDRSVATAFGDEGDAAQDEMAISQWIDACIHVDILVSDCRDE